jgi:HrpA-like RNA helicase
MPLPTLLVPGSIPGSDELPIKYITNWLTKRMVEFGHTEASLNDRVLIIRAETGSGKSTVMPVELFRLLRNKDTPINIQYRGQKVLCTQPRILTAIELAKTVSYERSPFNPDMIVGKTVGYSTGPKKERAAGLMYVTSSTLRVKMNTNPDESILDEYKFIIIDEAHERSVDSDILLFMLYKFYKRNEHNKKLPFLILTSATFDTNKYATYFGVSDSNIITVIGSSFKRIPHWLTNDTNDIYNTIINTLIEINKNKDDPSQADVLIFVPGVKEAKEIQKRIENKIDDYLLVLKLESEAIKKETNDYLYVFESYNKLPKKKGKLPTRRVIVSTAVAETGLTINTLKYVIDMGFHKGVESYPIFNTRGLITRPSTQSRITQRRGRVGRLFDGHYYPMYTEQTFKLLDEQQLPDIITSSNEYNNVHLLFYRLLDNEFSIDKLHLLDMPSQETFIGANSIATLLGFIDNNCKLTDLGLIASRFSSIPMEGSKIILSGFAYPVALTDLITIVALMQTSNNKLFMRDNVFKNTMQMNHIPYRIELPCNAQMIDYVLPNYITEIVGRNNKDSQNNQNSKENHFYYRYKTIICDDFIETLIAFEAFNKAVMNFKNIKEIDRWCQTHCISTASLELICDIRDRIIDDLVMEGIDITYGSEYRLIDQNIDNFMQTIINIKQCLYEGLKHNLLIYDDATNKYKTLQGLQVTIDNSLLSVQLQNKLKEYKVLSNNINPKYLLTDHFDIVQIQGNQIMYEVNANYISILDGYVNPDFSFGNPNNKSEKLNDPDNNIIDELSRLYSFNNISKDKDINVPICSLNYSESIFNKKIIEKIIDPVCK